ncbi:MAG: SAM hydrolase/SAM-dependent halogenase family protein [Bryobacteraceae bacterium]
MLRPIITLTTDFGLQDHFTGVMKGVILGIEPRASVVDITHEVPKFDTAAAAFSIAETWRWFPEKTIHVIVVDPGVGSSRRPILVEADGHFFIAPDNGLLSPIYAARKTRVRHIENRKLFLNPVSRTFHGRDIFAPSAAHLAKGVPPSRFGKLIQDFVQIDFPSPRKTGNRTWSGIVLHVDYFGNLITNLPAAEFEGLATGLFELAIEAQKVTRFARSYSEGQPGELLLVAGSSGYLEVAMNQSSAASKLRSKAAAPVKLTLY